MAVKFLDNLDLNDNQLLNARLENLASDPGSANAGDVIFNTTSNTMKYYSGSTWVNLTADTTVEAATSTTLGSVKLFSDTDQSVAANLVSTTSGRTYGIQLNSSNQAVVNVPWTTFNPASIEYEFAASSGSPSVVTAGGTMTFAEGTGITTTNNGSGTITIANARPYDGITLASTSGSNSTIANSGTITLAAGTGITTTNNGSGQVTIAATGSGSMSSFTVAGDSGSNQTISDGNTLTLTGGVGIDTATSATDTATFTLDLEELSDVGLASAAEDKIVFLNDGSNQGLITMENVPLSVWGAPTGNVNFNSKKITSLLDPTAAQDAATKNYVDTNIVGNLVFQGGYNAATNTPDLDSSPSASIKKGWAYVVTAAGSFFTETVEVGDFLIAQQDAPTLLSEWVTVQNNVGLATTTTPGIASFTVASFDVSAAGEVTLKDSGVTAATYGSATAVSKIAINAKGQVTSAVNQTIAIPHTAVTDFDTEVDARITAREFDGTNSGSGTSHAFTHNLNSQKVIVQLYDSSTFETVFAKVVRTSVNVVTVTTATSLSAGDITALITVID